MSSTLKDKTKISPNELAKKFESMKICPAIGGVGFKEFQCEDLLTVFRGCIAWEDSLSDIECERIARNAVFEAGKKGKITKESLLEAVRQLEAQYFAAPVVPYCVISTISLRYEARLREQTLNGVRLSFYPELPEKYGRQSRRGFRFPVGLEDLPQGYSVVVARVLAKSPYSACSKAMVSLEVLRGIWNYVINRRTISQSWIGGGSSLKPMNQIRLGPVHTIHLPGGEPATEEKWTNMLQQSGEPADLRNEWDKIQKATSWCIRRYRQMSYQKDASSMWIRYANAFDRADPDTTFLKLWSLLEFITGTVGGPYNETIARTLFICSDREYDRLILEHLRDRRNGLVHADEVSSQVDQHVFQLKRYVEELMRLHLVLRHRFKNMSEFGGFLSLPYDPAELKRKQKLYRFAEIIRRKMTNTK